ncbi:TetR/AcrR family transcriptional regulator [Streptomyces sp. NPDC052040]|uniref:TetR/AcrR family transcriptional regulator n=1 Tax=unclassified Streptomyces TaxID=2593676 RepID=UPI0037CD2BCF
MTEPLGRRERKKAATRRSLADAALRLFLERGYDQVTLRDIADAADVSTTTLLKHFPAKEALVFDEESDQEAALVAAVRDRAPGRSIPGALCAHLKRTRAHPGDSGTEFGSFVALVRDTPALAEYAHRMWMRHQDALARAIAEESGADALRCAALARFALESTALADRAPAPDAALDAAFTLLEHGWPGP